MAKEKLVKIKILNQIGSYSVGQEVEVEQKEADALCAPRAKHDGHKVVTWYPAMTLAKIEELKKVSVDKGGLTQDELEKMGLKNTIDTPVDAEFEKRLASIKGGEAGSIEARDEQNDKSALRSGEKY